MMMRKALLIIVSIVFLGTTCVIAGDEPVPAWLAQASKASAPQYDKEVPAVVLHSEQNVTVDSTGMLTISTSYAVRLLTRQGKAWADAYALYLRSSSKVKEIRAWLVRPDGTKKYYGGDNVLDRISDPDDIYDEYRVKTIDASGDADIGMVFGWETVVEERPLFTQDRWEFQRRLPTLYSRYTLNLPAGWQAKSVTFNRPEITPSVSGSRYIWELRDLAPIPPEPDSLSVSNLAPRIVVNYAPSAATVGVYNSWTDVSKWYTELSDPALTLNDEIAIKARELTANAKTELEKIQRIGEYVQSMRYISLDINVARGGGHRPRPASLVLQRGFGDCKDKANLMRAMLKALKIESYLVLIYSGDPTYVRQEWASPSQFNHCIIAIRVGAETIAPTVFQHEKLGRLLMFDATDPYTLVGDLPEHEQGSFALVAAGDDGGLVKMPVVPPDFNKMERVAEVNLTADGSIDGKILQSSYGQSAAYERGRLRELSAADYNTSWERWLSTRLKGGTLTKALTTEKKEQGMFGMELEFKAVAYAQIMQNRLMVFNPAMVGRLDQFSPVEGKRHTPILIDSSAYSETIKIKLPDGFEVDEIPAAEKVDTAFGVYSSEFKVVDRHIQFNRSLVMKRSVIEPNGYDAVKNFFGVVRNAEQTPVVLIRK